jgi:zinc-binding alcohol dehydrogenase family protein
MKAVIAPQHRPITEADALRDVDLPEPTPGEHDLLVEVRAVSVNPVDTKVRRRPSADGKPRVLGWDAAGVVLSCGAATSGFAVGDAVFYAGSMARPGCDSERHVVDARIVGPKPASLSFAEAAALPLTAITAWEMLFDRLQLPTSGDAGTLLIIGGAGGVGSIAIQLARQRTAARIVATASRPETRDWCLSLGAHEVIDHAGDMPAQLTALGIKGVERIFCTQGTDQHWKALVRALAPQGRIGVIDDPDAFDVRELKPKSASLHWEAMFARSGFGTPDMIEQHRLLAEVSAMVDAGRIRTTLAEQFGTINAANLTRAHAAIEAGRTRGKIVLEGF